MLIPPQCQLHELSIEDTPTKHYKQLICHTCTTKRKAYKHLRWLNYATYCYLKDRYPENQLSLVCESTSGQ